MTEKRADELHLNESTKGGRGRKGGDWKQTNNNELKKAKVEREKEFDFESKAASQRRFK